MATKVTLRQKAISKGRQTLYLDYYPAIAHPTTGEPTRREFLKLYVFDKARTPIDKLHNKETMEIAEQIRQRKENEINKPEIYTAYEKEQLKAKQKGEHNFVAYFKQLADKRTDSNADNWHSAYNYLNDFTGGSIRFADLNERFCNDFKDYLLTAKTKRSTKATLSQNSAFSYHSKLKAVLKQAYKEGFLQTDLNARIDNIQQAETHRNFLTLEELNTLVKTDCLSPLLKKAALFSALTGLRFSDIKKLVWGEVEYSDGVGYYLKFWQQKTKGAEVMPIPEQAAGFMGDRKKPNDCVFDGLIYSAYQNGLLQQWIRDAGIKKTITFHCFRHTYATLQLSMGTDIYTVSKMLGHKDLKTTQIYAKIVDQTKIDTTNKIKLDI